SDAALVPEILRTRASPEFEQPSIPSTAPEPGKPLEYLLMVATIEPRKNHAALTGAWEELRAGSHAGLKLVVVGAPGWGHEPIMKRMAPWFARGELYAVEDVPPAELRRLYRHARATVCPSFGEGFDFPGIEAMRCGCPVIASDIPVHREVFGDAAEYFSPYSSTALAQAIAAVIDQPGRARELRAAGDRVSSRYLPDTIIAQWRTYLQGLRTT
ncbi:MAG TPA: glycosyltransferase family 1 protein, partial [Usitatibacter sp.]|nr:glycosyltransferase family 1 protein [Usitatibacter sp.]